MKKTGVFIVRHGQTAWNKEEFFRGTVDVPLNDHGIAEARQVGRALQNEPITFIYSSPLSRAIQTAQPLAELKGIKVVENAGFIDMNFGKWEGRKLADVKRDEPDLFAVWAETPQKCLIPGGETLEQVQRRALESYREIVLKHEGETGVIVSHRVVCKLLMLGLLGLGADKFWNLQQDTACINLFETTGEQSVAFRINDVCHLSALNEGRITADF